MDEALIVRIVDVVLIRAQRSKRSHYHSGSIRTVGDHLEWSSHVRIGIGKIGVYSRVSIMGMARRSEARLSVGDDARSAGGPALPNPFAINTQRPCGKIWRGWGANWIYGPGAAFAPPATITVCGETAQPPREVLERRLECAANTTKA
jgi:hypothetical protein